MAKPCITIGSGMLLSVALRPPCGGEQRTRLPGDAMNAAMAVPARRRWREVYLRVLLWSFTLFNLVRLATYVPTIWAIGASGQSDQHSLVTWIGWTLSNLTMALWLYERGGQRMDGAVALNFGNALMCGVIGGLITWYRW